MTNDSLPTFLGIGTFKSATTWLYDALRERPDVFLPEFKEVHFFTKKTFTPTDLWTTHGMDWYRDLFAAGVGVAARGEISPGYLSDHDAAARIHQVLPQVRLIALLRQPADRAWSHYWFRRGKARIGYEFEQLVRDPDFDPDGFIRMGRYHEHLTAYLEHFEREQLLVRLMSDVKVGPEQLWREVCEHIRIPERPVPQAVFRKSNPSRTRRSRLVYQAKRHASRLLTTRGLHGVHRTIKRMGLPELVDRLNDRRAQNPRLPAELRAALTSLYRDDILRLQDLLDRDLGEWLEPRVG